jgi:two-component system response regulator NreC
MPIRIELADDHTLLRQGLRLIIESQPDLVVVAEATSGLEAVTCAETSRPDVAVLDIGMSEMNGIEAASHVLRKSPHSAVLILSMHCNERYVSRAIEAGASGYLLKDAVEDELVQAIRAVHNGHRFFSPAILQLLHNQAASDDQAEELYRSLSRRERVIYQLLAEAKSNRQVAERLGLSLHTVETHRSRIMSKLGIHNSSELVLSAFRLGLIH